ncbi:MAG TPA: Pup--protein ligase [Actinomycetales bacterium]|nr:Pup--protein ligase [Actinomycetales bacterium]
MRGVTGIEVTGQDTRRIFGIETEVGIAVDAPAGLNLGPEEVARAMFRPVVTWGRSSNVFLPNGARLYLDVGSHPEYATGECDSVHQLIVHDRAGDRILQGMAEKAQAGLGDEESPVAVHLFKNNLDSEGNSLGCHENYLVRRKIPLQRYTDPLIPFLVSRTLLTGSGGIFTDSAGSRFVLSPRAFHVWEAVSSATTRSRPMINSRDEPHADPEHFRRLHIIVGDSSRAEPTVALKIGAMDLVLRMIEAGVNFSDVRLVKPITALRVVSNDIRGKKTLELASGKRTTALALQERFLARAQDFVAQNGANAQDRSVLDLWERAVAAIADKDLEAIGTELDWVIKYRLFQRYRERSGAQWSDPRLARLDLAYHDLSPDRGIFERLEEAGEIKRLTTEREVLQALVTPPQTTRAKLRGDFVRYAQEHGVEYTVDWVHLRLNAPPTRTVACRDPFVAQDDRVAALLA